MIFKSHIQIILILASLCSLIWLLRSHLKAKQALQWWCYRQSRRLCQQAEKIRDGLLQESFSIRRSLELSLCDNVAVTTNNSRKHLQKIDKFHHQLAHLSDELSPAYVEDNLSLAIQAALETWLACDYKSNLHIEMPSQWQDEPRERNMIILDILAELLRLTLPSETTQISLDVSLQASVKTSELIVKISYADVSTLLCYSKLQELKYLSTAFRLLIPGKCFYRQHEQTLAAYFYWQPVKKVL